MSDKYKNKTASSKKMLRENTISEKNILKNPLDLNTTELDVLVDKETFTKLVREKAFEVLNPQARSSVTKWEAAHKIVSLYRLRIDAFVKKNNLKEVQQTVEDFESLSNSILKAGNYNRPFDIFTVSKEDILELERVLEEITTSIRNVEPTIAAEIIKFSELFKKKSAEAVAAWGGPLTIKNLRTRYRILSKVFESD